MPDGPIRAPVSEGKICALVSAVTIPRFRRRRERNGLPFLLPLSRGAVSEVAAELSNCKFCRERADRSRQARCAFGYFYRIIKVARSRWSGTSPIKKNLKTVCFKFHPRPNSYI